MQPKPARPIRREQQRRRPRFEILDTFDAFQNDDDLNSQNRKKAIQVCNATSRIIVLSDVFHAGNITPNSASIAVPPIHV